MAAVLPDFQRMFRTARSAEEERNVRNRAFFKLCAFTVACIVMVSVRRSLDATDG